MEVVCTHCGQLCWVPEHETGNELLCPVCDRSFVALAVSEQSNLLTDPFDVLTRQTPVVFGPAIRSAARRGKRNARSLRRRLRIAALAASTMLLLAGGAWLASLLVGWARNSSQFSGGYAAEAGDEKRIVSFRPEPDLAVQLTHTKAVEQFALDLPANYILFNVLSDPPWLPRGGYFVGAEFRGPPGARSLMYCWVVTFRGYGAGPGSLEKALDRFYTWLAHNQTFSSIEHTRGEVGKLGDRFCIRSEFSGAYRVRGKMNKERRVGSVYIMVDGDRQVSLYTFCLPEEQQSRRLLETALLTWRDKQKKADGRK